MDQPVYPHQDWDPSTFKSRREHGIPLKAYAAIQLRVPASGIPELDEMIRQARRQEMVGRALQGIIASGASGIEAVCVAAVQAADAAMMEQKKP